MRIYVLESKIFLRIFSIIVRLSDNAFDDDIFPSAIKVIFYSILVRSVGLARSNPISSYALTSDKPNFVG